MRRLGDDARVGAEAAQHGLDAVARVLLVGDGGHDDVAARAARRAAARAGEHDRREAALHVVGAAPVEAPVAHPRLVRVGPSPATPTVSVWAMSSSAAPPPVPRATPDDVRAPGRLVDDRHLEAALAQPRRDVGGDLAPRRRRPARGPG